MPIPSVQKLTCRRPCRALAKEWTDLIKLKEQSLGRKIAVYEEDKKRIAEIFERINQAREQLVVRICLIVVIFRVYSSFCLGGDRSQSPQDRTCNTGRRRGV
jgi:hypothetical protein